MQVAQNSTHLHCNIICLTLLLSICFNFLLNGMRTYLLFQGMFLLLQTDFFSTHQLQSLLRNCILKLFHTFHCCCPCCLTKLLLVRSHSIIHSYRKEKGILLVYYFRPLVILLKRKCTHLYLIKSH